MSSGSGASRSIWSGGCRVSGQLSERVLVDQQLVEPAFEVTRLGL
jgi:hypothetical protein